MISMEFRSWDVTLCPHFLCFQFLKYVREDVLVALLLQATVRIREQGVCARVVEEVEGTLGIDVEAFGQKCGDAAGLLRLLRGLGCTHVELRCTTASEDAALLLTYRRRCGMRALP